MKNKGVFSAAILAAVLCISSTVLAGTYSGGNGSTGNPYKIANVTDWQELANTNGDWGSCFILTADINLSGGANGIGNVDRQFTGVFDGNNNVISGAVINQPGSAYVGLFGWVGSGGQIRNLGVEDVNITGNIYVGGLVGYNSSGTLTKCYATGSVTGTGSENQFVGGLVGSNNSGTLTGCYATGSVSGTYTSVGGLVGESFGLSSLTDCYATGSVNGIYWVGGLVGINSSVLTSCYATGSVSGTQRVGGLVGLNSGIYGTLTDCYATGPVTGTSNVGGLVGWNNSGSLTDCYATGPVNGTSFVGGLAGANSGSITACFWDVNTSGKPTSAGGTGKTTAEMKTLSTFTSAGWDFVSTWGIFEHQAYPYLRTQPSADLNYDGVVNFKDFAIFAGQWLEGT